jgi:hypothetical protein
MATGSARRYIKSPQTKSKIIAASFEALRNLYGSVGLTLNGREMTNDARIPAAEIMRGEQASVEFVFYTDRPDGLNARGHRRRNCGMHDGHLGRSVLQVRLIHPDIAVLTPHGETIIPN